MGSIINEGQSTHQVIFRIYIGKIVDFFALRIAGRLRKCLRSGLYNSEGERLMVLVWLELK